MEVNLPNLVDGYVAVCNYVQAGGAQVTVRDHGTRELLGVTLIVPAAAPMLPVGVGRRLNRRLAAVEALQLIGGVSRPDLLARAAPEYGAVLVNADPKAQDYAAYGPRTALQVQQCVGLLQRDPTTRQGVVAIWRREDFGHRGDKPCTLSLQFMIRNGFLDLHSTMRSQDVWLGLAYDLFMFTQLQRTIAGVLGIPVGQVYHHVASLHAYDRDRDKIADLHMMTPDTPNLCPAGVAPLRCGGNGEAELRLPATHARRLLEGTAWPAVLEDNPWYAEQLTKLGLYETVKV